MPPESRRKRLGLRWFAYTSPSCRIGAWCMLPSHPMTPELRHSIATRARAVQVRLNEAGIDAVAAAKEAKRIFEDAGDAARMRWLTLELAGSAEHVPARPLHVVLGVPAGDRLAAHVAAYRSQRGTNVTPGQQAAEFRHFFVEPLAELVATRARVATRATGTRVVLEFGPEQAVPSYPRSGEFTRDVFDRVVLGFVAALHLQLGDWRA